MCEHRNSIKHSDLSLQAQERIRQVDAEIHSQFDMGTSDLPPLVRQSLSGDRRRVLRKSLVDKEVWLRYIRAERVAQRRSLRAQRKMLGPSSVSAAPPPLLDAGNQRPLSFPAAFERDESSSFWKV